MRAWPEGVRKTMKVRETMKTREAMIAGRGRPAPLELTGFTRCGRMVCSAGREYKFDGTIRIL